MGMVLKMNYLPGVYAAITLNINKLWWRGCFGGVSGLLKRRCCFPKEIKSTANLGTTAISL